MFVIELSMKQIVATFSLILVKYIEFSMEKLIEKNSGCWIFGVITAINAFGFRM